ncbi:MAG TPA: Gfo/Idh/MocA family oxidoreductase [Blastocatellia bacterium]|nr:Gfo/Idh/MocA family oxidoreductase [Blastocatellia bacterium]
MDSEKKDNSGNMGDSGNTSRRDFIRLAAATGLTIGASRKSSGESRTYLTPRDYESQPKRISPSDKIRLATIGIGGQGSSDTGVALRVPGVELVAVADVYDGRLARAKEVWGDKVFTTRDYREVLARPDVDAVIVATPDHWHAQIASDAIKAGKDVYCEKPMVQLIGDGAGVIDVWKKSDRIFQVGSQRVSSIVYQKAKELLASGVIGELNLIEAWFNRRSPISAWQYSIPPDASPQTVDWDRFLGRAPKKPFEPIRLFRWRNYRDYGTGIGGDLFVHLFSGIHYVVGTNGPSRVMATGGLRYWNDGRDVPDVLLGLYDYPKSNKYPAFNIALRVNFADGSVEPTSFESSGFRFVGSDAVITIGNGVTVSRKQRPKEPGYTINTFPKALQDQFLKEYREKYPEDRKQTVLSGEESYLPPPGYSDSFDHFTNFFNAVRSRTPITEDPVFGFRAAGPALLTNQSYFENRAYGWNPDTMRITGE